MELPRFDFAEHEWPPLGIGEREGLADAVFEAQWGGETRLVAAREVSCSQGFPRTFSLLFFRVLPAFDVTWGVGSRWGHLHAFRPSFDNEDLEHRVQAALQERTFGRAFLYTDEKDVSHWVQLEEDRGSGRMGCWNGVGTSLPLAQFHFQEATLQEQMQDENSDARFALWWAQQTRDQQVGFAVRFSRGSASELRGIVRSLAVLDGSARAHRVLWFSGEFRFDNSHISYDRPNARWRRWAVHLQKWFAWHIDENLAARHLCIENFSYAAPIEIEIPQQPSAHERLEAALFLSDWAQGKIPPAELRLLLPKL